MNGSTVMPIRFAARHQRNPAFYSLDHVRPKGVIMCRRMVDQRARQDAALVELQDRKIDDSKD